VPLLGYVRDIRLTLPRANEIVSALGKGNEPAAASRTGQSADGAAQAVATSIE
jgi:hypothetical protein